MGRPTKLVPPDGDMPTRAQVQRRASGRTMPVGTRRRAIAAVRVSKEREGMTSPEVQRFIIEQFAEREQIQIVAWIEGIDESGSRKKSAWWSRLDYACDQVEARVADDVIVWRVDRVGRNKLKWAQAEDRIETAGGWVLSATEPNDHSPAGRFGRDMLISHGVYMANQIGATWRETLDRRVRHGLTPNGQPHFGYTYSKITKTYEIDPVEGPILAAMYRAYAAGDSGWQIADRLNGPDPQPGPQHTRWNTPAVLRVLDSGFGAGLIRYKQELHDGAHDPVITADEWARYLGAREARRRRPRAERSKYLYSGLIYCHCGGRMGGRTDHGRPRYACTQSASYRPHPDASLAAHIIDAEVLKTLAKLRDKLNKAAREAPRRPRAVKDPSVAIKAKLANIATQLDNAGLRLIAETLPEDSYNRIRDSLEAKRRELEAELARASAQSTIRPLAFVGDLVEQWPHLAIERRREALRLLVDRIVVDPPGSEPRVRVESELLND